MEPQNKQRVVGVISGAAVTICGVATSSLASNRSSLLLLAVGIAMLGVGVVGMVGSAIRWDVLVRRPMVIFGAYLPLMGLWLLTEAESTAAKALWSVFVVGAVILLLVSLRRVEGPSSVTTD